MTEMTSAVLIWVVGGALAVLAGMIVVLIVARTLDGSHDESQRQFANKLSELAGKAKDSAQLNSAPAWLSGAVSETLTALADASKDTRGDPKEKEAAVAGRKQVQATLTGLAVAGGIIMLIVGIITGDGS